MPKYEYKNMDGEGKHRLDFDGISKKNLVDLLQQEIDWCLDNPSNNLSKDAQTGFMNGLRQAQYLIDKAFQLSKK